jgi:mono/diheme cytochrome c family protein
VALSDDTASKGYPAAACGCLLLPIAACCSLMPMIVLLFVIGGTTVVANPKAHSLSGDLVNGGRLFSTFQPAAGIACSTCHRIDSQERLVGPGLLNVERQAEARVKGMDAVAYLRESIVNPGAYVVAGYADIMPKSWTRVFSEKQIDDLIAYLLTLKGR